MVTTSLFVELVVIGVGASVWLSLVLVTLFGPNWISHVALLPAGIILVPVLALVYLLGILTDRLADFVFDKFWSESLIENTYSSLDEYYQSRSVILTKSKEFADLLEYGRSRMRICRGWTVNCALILVAANMVIWQYASTQPPQLNFHVAVSALISTLGLWCWYTWRRLVISEYRKIKSQAAILQKIKLVEDNQPAD